MSENLLVWRKYRVGIVTAIQMRNLVSACTNDLCKMVKKKHKSRYVSQQYILVDALEDVNTLNTMTASALRGM